MPVSDRANLMLLMTCLDSAGAHRGEPEYLLFTTPFGMLTVGVPDHGGDDDDEERRPQDGTPEPGPSSVEAHETHSDDAVAGAALERRDEDDLDGREDREDRERIPAEEPRDQVCGAVVDEERPDAASEPSDRAAAFARESETFSGVALGALGHRSSVSRRV